MRRPDAARVRPPRIRATPTRTAWRSWLLAVGCAAAGLLAGGCQRPGPEGQRLVVITLDTLRYDSLGEEGGATTMPALAARAAGCARFERFYSATSSTQPTHATLFTALHPWQHGVTRNGLALGPEHHTLAERLREAGYETAAAVASFPVSARFGFGQGFDRFDDSFRRGRPGEAWAAHAEQEEVDGAEERFYSLASDVTDRALALLDGFTGPRQLLWVHYFDPHSPYGDSAGGETVSPRTILEAAAAGEEGISERVAAARRLYDLDVAFLDTQLARLLERLDAEAGRFETHVAITADHGESFGEDGSLAHGRRLTPGQIHVPLLLCSPRVPAESRRDVAGSVDLTPTLLALAGLGRNAGTGEAGTGGGRDLTAANGSPGSRAGTATGMRRTYARTYEDLRLDGTVQVIDGHLFYLVDREGTLHRGDARDLLAPEDGNAPAADDLARRLRGVFGRYEEELLRAVSGEAGDSTETDPEVERGLRALGYATG